MRRLALLAHPPGPGRLPSRLAPALPVGLAADLYAALLDDALDAARACRADERTIWWDGEPANGGAPAGFAERRQPDGAPAARFAAAFADLVRAPGDHAVVTATDLPGLRTAHLEAAFGSLGESDLVLGPSNDGCCWLAGLARPAPGLFDGLPDHGPDALDLLLAAAARAGLRVRLLARLDDLASPHDLVRFVAAEAAGDAPVFGANGREALRRIGMLPA